MKVESTSRRRIRVSAVIDVIVEAANWPIPFIGDRNARMVCKEHREKRIQTFVAANGQEFGFPALLIPETQTKEIPDRAFHVWHLLVIPVHMKYDALEVIWLVVGDGEPDVRDSSRSVRI